MFFLLHRHTDDDVYDDFPKITDHVTKISEEFPKFVPKARQTFPNISENFRRLPKTFKGDSKMFRSYTNKVKHNLRHKLDTSEIIDIFTALVKIYGKYASRVSDEFYESFIFQYMWIINIVYVIESAAYGVLFTRCLCQKPSLARTSLVRVFDTNNS